MRGYLNELRGTALRSLARMWRRDQGIFAFRLRRAGGRDLLEGVSVRYTAMALIGLAGESEAATIEILRGETPESVCRRLIAQSSSITNMGDVASILWAAAELGIPEAEQALGRLIELDPTSDRHPTVERAWALTALTVHRDIVADDALAEKLARGLLESYHTESCIFPHMAPGAAHSRLRAHVACYADLVYPIIALSKYGRALNHQAALDAARSCADHMCRMQGRHGQWWWHFDVRTGGVVEEYPVYAVHQDAMAPMALFAAEDACGADYAQAIARGLEWLRYAPEINGSLFDHDADVIWRKVCRREPGKLSRSLNAGFSAIHRGFRAPGVNTIFKPTAIDHESRPYHMGWILYAWPQSRVNEFSDRRGEHFNEQHAGTMAELPSV